MLKGQDIICISSIDWDFIWQGHQEIMSTLAGHGNRVLFVENTGVRRPNFKDLPRLKKRLDNWFRSVKGIRRERDNLYVYSPLILPFPYSRPARWINKRILLSALRRWMKSAGFSNPIIWTFLPTGIVLDIIDAIDSKAVIYYCIDNFEASSPGAAGIKKTEEVLLERADLVFVTSQSLYNRCSAHSKNIHLFPYGVSTEVYGKAAWNEAAMPADIRGIPRPIVGYIGGIHKWMDFDLLKFLAVSNPDKSFIFVGPLQRDVAELKTMSNVRFLGQKDYRQLPSYVAQFDACLIPYLLTEYTMNVYPTKINEYLALGKSVVSTAIPEVEAFNVRNGDIIYVGHTHEEFNALLKKTLSEKVPDEICRKRIETAVKEGAWNTKIETMSRLIADKIARNAAEKAENWKNNLLKLYKSSTRRLAPVLVVLAALYLLVFYTPLVWFAAEPLKVATLPAKADCIAVFGGGVGESGRAGQGYEERVGYAVKLYKDGYAGNIILSSGYSYFYEETLLMKALAVSLGVPKEAIIIENKAGNTYENVKYTKEILEANGWRKALVVSSPYHMKRVELVFRRIAPEITVLYAPLPHSSFYSRNRGSFFERAVMPRQINGILHEYISILYYLFKGYA